MPCKICGGRLLPSRLYKKTCSRKCQKQITGNYKEEPVIKTCKKCGCDFATTNDVKIYCSKDCSINAHRFSQTDFSLFKRDDFRCIYCGKSSIEHGIKLVVEHIQPVLFNGLTNIDNLITACEECNTSKSSTVLSPAIKERIYKVLLSRNSNISIQLFSQIERDIEAMQPTHAARVNRVKNSNRKRIK